MSALRWMTPSAAAAASGALAGGALEAASLEGLDAAAAAGFVALWTLPILLVASVVARGLWAAWRADLRGLVDADGVAPRLAAWVAVVWLSILGLAWVMFQGTWQLARLTAFKPNTLSFAEPALAVGATLALVAVARPAARGLARFFARLARARRLRPLLRPSAIGIVTAVKSTAVSYLTWRLLVRPRLGPIDLAIGQVPAVALATVAVTLAAWPRLGRARRVIGPLLAAAALGVLAASVHAWRARPARTLAIWGERPFAGLAIDTLFDLDAIRARIPLAALRPAARPGSDHPDIVLVTIDTVRADRTPPYGGPAEMPVLRELGLKGAVFEWAYAPSNVTRRSIPSMVTGLAPNRVRGRVVGWALRLDPRHVLLAERLVAGGYDTAGFVCCNGFWGDEFRTGLQRGLQTLVIEPAGMTLARRARAWIEARERTSTRKPLFVWMHVIEPHNWPSSAGAATNDEDRRRAYDRALTASDAMMTELFGAFGGRTPEAAPIVIVSADHGEGLGDHGQPYHSTDLYNSQLRVPLVIAGPGVKPGRIRETVSLVDLTPTVLELAGFEAPSGATMDGRSLADLARGTRVGDPEQGLAFAAMIKDRSNPGGLTAVVRGPWKLLEGAGVELYNVHQDPGERSNVASAQRLVARQLEALLDAYQARAGTSPFEP